MLKPNPQHLLNLGNLWDVWLCFSSIINAKGLNIIAVGTQPSQIKTPTLGKLSIGLGREYGFYFFLNKYLCM